MSPHLSDDQLIQRLYLAAAEPHLDACPECQVRWTHLQQRHALLTTLQPPPPAFFTDQLRGIQHRIEANSRPPAPWFALRSAWIPATLSVMILAGLVYNHVTVTAPPALTELAVSAPEAEFLEASWFEDAYASIDSIEPRAASPLRELFVEVAE